jgi:hypothetical protein
MARERETRDKEKDKPLDIGNESLIKRMKINKTKQNHFGK